MKNRFAIPAVILLLMASTGISSAQVSSLPFTQFIGSYTPIGNANTLTTGLIGSLDDGYWTVNFGFPFPFNGNTYTTCYVGTNGYVTLGAGTTSISNVMNVNFAGRAGVLSPFNTDSRSDPADPIRWEVGGAAPNRVLTIQFNGMSYWTNSFPTPFTYNYQVKMYEGSGMIEFVYGDLTDNVARTVYAGVASTTTDFQRRIALQGTNTWETSTPNTTTTTAFSNFNATFGPPRGLTYRFGCFVPSGVVNISLSDAFGQFQGYYETPGPIRVNYTVSYPLNEAYSVPITLNFYRVGDPSTTPVYTESFVAQKPVGVLNGFQVVNVNLPPAYYIVEAVFSVYNNCLFYEDVSTRVSTLFIKPGTQLCEVWPGDVNNDGIVNYGDRASLNKYIFEANLRSSWLNGPARYKFGAESNPLAYLAWEPQPSIPWSTPEGCYMDADGNGVINNFDYIAIKLNWLRDHGHEMHKRDAFSVTTFDMDQNYPNPFNPSTTIRYSVPERSMVTLTVSDMLGREIATLVSGTVESGVHQAVFDAVALPSGSYVASVVMTGVESGLSFSKTMRMALNK
jgi:hypothetical protein